MVRRGTPTVPWSRKTEFFLIPKSQKWIRKKSAWTALFVWARAGLTKPFFELFHLWSKIKHAQLMTMFGAGQWIFTMANRESLGHQERGREPREAESHLYLYQKIYSLLLKLQASLLVIWVNLYSLIREHLYRKLPLICESLHTLHDCFLT